METPTGTATVARTAATAGPMADAARLSAPVSSRGCMWIAAAPAATTAAAASASCAGVSGTAGWAVRRLAPLRQHFTNIAGAYSSEKGSRSRMAWSDRVIIAVNMASEDGFGSVA